MPPTDRNPVNQARLQLQTARINLTNALFVADQAQTNLDEAKRVLTGEALDSFQHDVDVSSAAVTAARIAVTQARSGVTSAISTWLGPGTGKADVDADLARLDASAPVVLFPVRLETRFGSDAQGPILQVRVYPDEILLNTHEYALTPAELEAGARYWRGEGEDPLPPEPERWRTLVNQFPAQRAAYIVRATRDIHDPPYSGCVPYPYYVPGGVETSLPNLPMRSDAWTRAGEAVLPDRWVVIASRKGRPTRYQAGAPIPEPLSLTVNPSVAEDDLIDLGNGFVIDKDIAWTVDFDRAVSVGMGLVLRLDADEAANGFDRLVVVGVKSSLAPIETSGLIENLFDAHHYTRGLAIVPQGTPTNNTTGQATPFPPEDPQGSVSFPVERQPPPPDLGKSHQVPTVAPNDLKGRAPTDFDHLATALGVPNSVFQNVDGAFGLEQYRAEAMNGAIWPATLGYFMSQMMLPANVFATPLFSNANIDSAQAYFRAWVRGRGPVPAFRVGQVPYGVLPVLALSRWARRAQASSPDADEDLEAKMLPVLRRLREIWKNGERPQTLQPSSTNPFDPLLVLLSEDASSTVVRLRDHVGPATSWNLGALIGGVVSGIFSLLGVNAQSVMTQLGLSAAQTPRVTEMTFGTFSSLFEGGFAQADDGAPALKFDYFTKLSQTTGLADLRDDTNIFPAGVQKPLLYLLLRHSILLEAIRLGRIQRPDLFNFKQVPVREPEQWPPNLFSAGSPFDALNLTIAPAPITTTLFDVVRNNMGFSYFPLLEKLSVTPPPELARLLSETLDLVSHRLDAWVTAFATHRLRKMREAQIGSCFKPIGDFLGGYGWVEDVRPAGPGVTNAGFIHAPSEAHAAAAAILRCGFFAYRKAATNKYAVDLSSERARRAQRLIEEVRAGQPLGAALGYRFERGLHENYPTLSLDAFIYRFRHLFPQVANASGLDPFTQVDTVAARNVVDGLKLVRAPSIDFSAANQLPLPGTQEFNAIQAEITKLRDLFDAITDLVNAEAVFQMSTGDIAAAQANVDFLPSGEHAPDSELVRSERGGVGVSHRVLLVLPPTMVGSDENAPALPAGWPAIGDLAGNVGYERAKAEPFIDAWVGNRIGSASAVVATVRYKDDSGADQSYPVTLADLKVRPLDLLAIAQDETLSRVGTELQRRILGVAPPVGATVNDPLVDFDTIGSTPQAPKRSFPQAMEIARALALVLGGARPAVASDLVTPLEAADLDDGTAHPAAKELKARADAALNALFFAEDDLGDAEDAASQRSGLIKAARLVAGAFPPPPLAKTEDEDAQMAEATKVALAELAKRREAAVKAAQPDPANPVDDDDLSAAALNQRAADMLKAVFGKTFFALPAMGALPTAHTSELKLSLAARATLLGTDETKLQDSAPNRFLTQVALVRDGMKRWRSLSIYGRAMGRTADRLAVMQLPHVPGEPWAGRAVPPGPGRISLLTFVPNEFPGLDASSVGRNLRGLVLDDWVEAIPRKTEPTAVAFHFDHPNAEAPQAILVAVPAAAGATWTFDDLLVAVNETFELTDVRSINPESLSISPLIPKASLAFVPGGQEPSTSFENNKAGDRGIRHF